MMSMLESVFLVLLGESGDESDDVLLADGT